MVYLMNRGWLEWITHNSSAITGFRVVFALFFFVRACGFAAPRYVSQIYLLSVFFRINRCVLLNNNLFLTLYYSWDAICHLSVSYCLKKKPQVLKRLRVDGPKYYFRACVYYTERSIVILYCGCQLLETEVRRRRQRAQTHPGLYPKPSKPVERSDWSMFAER